MVIERNAQLAQAREQLVDLAVSRERERVARDVHDILGHSLTVITVKAELAGRLLEAVAGHRAGAQPRSPTSSGWPARRSPTSGPPSRGCGRSR